MIPRIELTESSTILHDAFVDDNYMVEVKHPSGKVIQILIPMDPETFVDHTRVGSRKKPDAPYGLNLVCLGHYQ